MNEIKKNLKDLGLNKNEAETYLALTNLGEAKATVVALKAGLSRTTVISILERLEKEGLVSSNKYKGSIYWWIESPTVLQEKYENKINIAKGMVNILSDLYRSEHSFPGTKVYDTRVGIQNFTERMLASLKKGSTIFTIDSPHLGNYQKVFSEEYNKIFIDIKNKKSIFTKTLVPYGSNSLIAQEKLEKQNIEIKEMPEGISFESSIWLIDDVVVFFASQPPYLVAIKNPAIYLGLKSIFDFLWLSKK